MLTPKQTLLHRTVSCRPCTGWDQVRHRVLDQVERPDASCRVESWVLATGGSHTENYSYPTPPRRQRSEESQL